MDAITFRITNNGFDKNKKGYLEYDFLKIPFVQSNDQISNTLLKDIDTLVSLHSFLKANQ